jgi:hypothetical protein
MVAVPAMRGAWKSRQQNNQEYKNNYLGLRAEPS